MAGERVTTEAAVFRARGVSKVYRMGEVEVHALREVDLDLLAGELLVLLGASGSGKSTLLNILGGLDVPSEGEVWYRARELTSADEAGLTRYRRDHVGFVFQFYNLIPSLTARENVALVTDIAAAPMAPEEALEMVGLAGRMDHFPAQLSGGEQQRVAIARAVAKRPDVLLCDEPTGALDFETGKRVLEVLERVNREVGTTTAIITHNAEIAGLGDRVVRMSSGRVVERTRNERRLSPDEIRGEAVVRALDRKLLREIGHHRGQMLSIAAVVAAGIMTVLTMRGTYESLVVSRAQYYRTARFPDAWAQLERAPESLRRRIQDLPGVAAVETRVTFAATLDVPGVEVPALGRFVSIPERRRSMLADLHLESGRYVAPGRRDEVLVSKRFAVANGFTPGDTLRAVINGRFRELEIVGTAISPEHVYAVPPGALYPDDERYGIVWMSREAVGPAYDMEGAFNEVALTLAPGADPDRVLSRLDRLLEPYGGLGAYGREDQLSHQILEAELAQNRTMGTVIPAVFLGVAAFLLNLVLGRMIATQRSEIAVLKAFGYSNREVGGHYLRFALAAVLAGALLGVAAGIRLGRGMVSLYGDFFDFPTLRYELSWSLVLIAAGVSALAAGVGALGAVRRAVRLPPAEAMRPEPPASFRPGFFERIGLGRLLPAAGRMILRNVERQPVRSLFSAVGVAFSVAILVIGMFMFDGVDHMMDLQFRQAQREDLALTFDRPLSESARYDLAHLEGVQRVEPYRVVPVRLRAGHREREAAITGVEPGGRLRRIVTADGGVHPLPPEGVVLSAILARQLGVAAGDTVAVEVLEGERRTTAVAVAGVVEDFLGLSVHMRLDALHRLARGGRSISGAYLSVEEGAEAGLNARLKRLPVVAGVASPGQMLASFEEQLAQGLFVAVFFILGFSALIAVAVIYNGARIALSERGRELASLRVLGFSRREVAVLLLGEQGIVTLVAIPLGWGVGYLLAAAVSRGLQTESYRIPLIVSAQTYLWSAAVTVLAAGLSGWIVRRRLDRMDLIEVLKTRE